LLVIAGCASSYSGFLDKSIYRKLKPGETKGSKIWIKESADLRTFDAIMIDPIASMPSPDADAVLTPELRKKAIEAFRKILVDKVGPYYPVVDKPAEHVLRVRIALTELKPTKILKPAIKRGPKITLQEVDVGAASLEVDFRDSLTNEVLCAAVSRILGSERGKEASEQWQAVEGAFHEWAERLLDFMDSHHE